METKPGLAISIIECDMQVRFIMNFWNFLIHTAARTPPELKHVLLRSKTDSQTQYYWETRSRIFNTALVLIVFTL